MREDVGAEGEIEPRPGEAEIEGAMLGADIGDAPLPVTEAPEAPLPERPSGATGADTV